MIHERFLPLVKTVLPDTESLEIRKLAGDASGREYYRITPDAFKASLPSRFVMMGFSPDRAKQPDEITDPEIVLNAFPFTAVQGYLERGGLRVPQVFATDLAAGLILLEDLGDDILGLRLEGAPQKDILHWYSLALDLLVEMQRLGDTRPEPDAVPFLREFGMDLLMWEFDHYLEWGLESFYGFTLPMEDRLFFRDRFEAIATELCQARQVLVHRDFQSRNIMVHQNKLALIDFQDMLQGPWPYDLVACLRDSYVRLDNEVVKKLVEHYLERLAEAEDSVLDKESFWRLFHLQTVQRKLKDAGRFVCIQRRKNNPSYLRFLPRSLAYVREALDQLPDYADLAERLGRYEKRLRQ